MFVNNQRNTKFYFGSSLRLRNDNFPAHYMHNIGSCVTASKHI